MLLFLRLCELHRWMMLLLFIPQAFCSARLRELHRARRKRGLQMMCLLLRSLARIASRRSDRNCNQAALLLRSLARIASQANFDRILDSCDFCSARLRELHPLLRAPWTLLMCFCSARLRELHHEMHARNAACGTSAPLACANCIAVLVAQDFGSILLLRSLARIASAKAYNAFQQNGAMWRCDSKARSYTSYP